MNEQTALTDLENEARDAYIDWLDASISGAPRRAKTLRLNKLLDKIADVMQITRKQAEEWLLRNVR